MTQNVKFITLGCKVNQYETQAMRESLVKAGVQEEDRSANLDFIVINTCTVTSNADRENLYWIRRARRNYPAAKIVVTGCFVERNRKQLEALQEVDLILANHEKSDIVDHLTAGCGTSIQQDELQNRKRRQMYSSHSISTFEGKGRAFVKIQDGCNHACTFCKVVMVRGRSRSRGLEEIVEEVKRLRDSGYKEIVFAGIQLGAYGDDFTPAVSLVKVLEACSKVEGIEQLRLSSIEPTDVDPVLIDALVNNPKCCPHLHIPLQSGDDLILSRMNRRYTRVFYLELIEQLRNKWPDFSLTLDVMAGFPGETDENFQNTLSLLEMIKPLKCHVFPYSKREGTRAASFGDVLDSVIRHRVNWLKLLADQWGRELRMQYVERIFPVIVEKEPGKGRLLQGLTPNYLKVLFQGDPALAGHRVWVKLLALEGDSFLGRMLNGAKE